MRSIGNCVAVLCAGLLIAEPCAAQGLQSAPGQLRPSAFAGVNINLPIGGTRRAEPSVRLQITTDYGSQYRRDASRNSRPSGVEIGLIRAGKPALFLNGRQASVADSKLGLGGSGGQTALIVGGVLLAVVVVAVAAGGAGQGDTCPTVGGSRDHCINP